MPIIAEIRSLSKVLSREGCMTLLRWRNMVWPQCSLTLVWSQGRQCQPESGQRGMKMQSSSVCFISDTDRSTMAWWTDGNICNSLGCRL